MDRGRKGNPAGRISNMLYRDLANIIKSEVLQYLPAKSLARFKSVCREWNNLISAPFFAHKQSNKSRDIYGFFIQTAASRDPPSFLSLDPASYGVPDPSLSFLPEPVEIQASSNGLLCCQGRAAPLPYYICNPVARTWKKLPIPSLDHGPTPAVVLIFEPSPLNFVAEYSLLCACPCVELGEGYEFEVYNSRDQGWRVFGEVYLGDKRLVPASGVHVNGVVYWQTLGGYMTLGFDLATERVKSVYGSGPMGVLNGRLCLAKVSFPQGLILSSLINAHTNTMQLNSRVKAWEQKLSVDLGPAFSPGQIGRSTRCVLYLGDKCVLLLSLQKLYAYDMGTAQFRFLRDDVASDVKVVAYVNGLVEI